MQREERKDTHKRIILRSPACSADQDIIIEEREYLFETEGFRREYYQILLFREDGGSILKSGKTIPVRKGMVYLLRPEEKAKIESRDYRCRYTSLEFSGRFLERISSPGSRLTSCFYRNINGEGLIFLLSEEDYQEMDASISRLKEVLREECFGGDLLEAAYSIQIVLTAFRGWSEKGYDPGKNMPGLVLQTMEYVQKHIQEQISIEELSRELYHNRSHISRIFKENAGISLQQYIINQRLSLVIQKLQEGSDLMTASESAGFNNYSNFIRTFKKHMGVSPHRYLKMSEVRDHSKP